MQDVGGRVHAVKGRLWEWEGQGAWHFITIESQQAWDIKKDWHWPRKGFGSIPVKVRLNSFEWTTSIFPEKTGSYLLPIKKSVRLSEKVKAGDTILMSLEVIT